MKKYLSIILLILLSFCAACSSKSFCTISFELNLYGERYDQKAILVQKGTKLSRIAIVEEYLKIKKEN